MKKEMKATIIASMLAIGLITGTAIAQTGTTSTTRTQQQMHGNMMGHNMMNGGMMNGGMMGGHWNQNNWGGMGCAGMMGDMMMNQMSPSQQQEFMNQTVDLRKQMMEKRFGYMEAMRNPNTTPQDLAKLEKDMLELRTKIMDKMNGLQGQ